ncbi:hypothetical protein GCM10025866_05250 [Naasia aerilata]|uniref:Glycine cleavage system P-protein N-terminal domain-containing protein n=1 Tax=Naasia aerilata TaxID=1162966 RepID=A0ABM8G8V6_9MICO|nr:hypothetical protein GCM10025866_05250 [Naasia aerilata]
MQYPGASGAVWDPREVLASASAAGAVTVVAADLLALTLLTSPGELGADVAVGTTQRFGVPMGFGGPHAGYLAVRAGLERQLPGRLVGVSQDSSGAPAYRLSLQAREQHIRREKATSNICTAQVLLAVMASMYAVYHGPDGLRWIARTVHESAVATADALRDAGVSVLSDSFFDTFLVEVADAAELERRARKAGILVRIVDETTIAVAFDEVSAADLRAGELDLVSLFTPGSEARPRAAAAGAADLVLRVPESLRRTSGFLGHPVFNTHHSETSMMRYLSYLAGLDYALDRGMIPLGSCTMKLNSAVEMESVTWPEFARIHPFAPAEDVQGYLELIGQLETWLAEVTGYDAVSLQPNAGSQGSSRGSSPSGATTRRAGTAGGPSASSPRARTAPMRPRRCWPGCGSSWSPATASGTSISRTCAPGSTSIATSSRRS